MLRGDFKVGKVPTVPRHARRPSHGAVRSTAGWLVPCLPAVTGLAAGAYRIGVPPIWRDEAATKAIAGRTVSQILATMPHDDVVHGAYYMVVHFAESAAGSESATVLRFPSLIAMAIACAFTALIARRCAVLSGSRYPEATGLIAGLVFASAPYMIRYAQEARSYAIVTMMVTIATYLLLVAAARGGRWWIGYGAAVALAGLFNIFSLLIVIPHGLSLLISRRRVRADAPEAGGFPVAWVIAVVAAGIVLIPLGLVAYAQRGALSWVSATPVNGSIVALARDGTGSSRLIWPIVSLAVFGVVAGLVHGRGRPWTPGIVALPWLALPPAILIAVSQLRPVYEERYVEFCLPALAILVAWGITWLARLVAATPAGRIRVLAWVPPVVAMAGLLLLLLPAEAAISQASSRPDNLERESQIIADNYLPGDIVFYIPLNDRIVSMPFPGPWQRLRDIALARSPVSSDTLYGTDVSPAELQRRFVHVTRVWVVASSTDNYMYSSRATPLDRLEVRLFSLMTEVRRWRDGDTMLTLYAVRK